MPKVTFRYTHTKNGGDEGLTFEMPVGSSVLECAVDHGVALDHDCGGNCACTTCMVYVESGAENISGMSEDERGLLEANDKLVPKARLGCQCRVQAGEVILRIP